MTKYTLHRNLFAGGTLYKRDIAGTELPDEIAGKRVVLFKAWDKKSREVFPLPRDASVYDEKAPRDAEGNFLLPLQPNPTELTPNASVIFTDEVKDSGPQPQVALSQMHPKPSPAKPVASTDKNPNILTSKGVDNKHTSGDDDE